MHIRFAIFLLFPLWGAAQKNISISEYTSSPVIVDGRIKEWPENFRYYEGEAKVQFALKHNDKELFLCFQTFDERAQMKIIRAGMQITLDAKAKKVKPATLTFPYRSTKLTAQETGSIRDVKSGRILPGGKRPQLYLHDFVNMEEGVYLPNDTIDAAYAFDSLKNMNLEFRIPFASFGYTPDPSKEITITVTMLAPEAMPALGGNGGMGENAERHRGGMNPYNAYNPNNPNGINPNGTGSTNGYNPNNADMSTGMDDNPTGSSQPVHTDMSESHRFSFKAHLSK
ncbi:MAG: hypothetical protein U0T73_13890 [Chitinophagales bacterium]